MYNLEFLEGPGLGGAGHGLHGLQLSARVPKGQLPGRDIHNLKRRVRKTFEMMCIFQSSPAK